MSAATATTSGTSALAAYEPSLDGMRGVCIVAVVVYHACAVSGLSGWMRGGFIGVSVFFTLSGFLITSLLLREQSATGGVSLRSFWSRRIRRLWPATFAVVLAVVLLSAWGPLSARSADTIATTWSVTNWHVIRGGEAQLLQTIVGPLGPTWSLAVEEQFYIVLALLFVMVSRLRHARTVLAVVATAGVLVPAVLTNVVSDWHPTLEFSTVLRMPELFMGVLLALGHHRIQHADLTARTGDLLAGGGLAVLVALFLLVDYSPPWLLRGGYTAVAVVSAVTIVGLLQRGAVARALGGQPLHWLGTVSYSLYLVHWPVYSVLTADRMGFDGVGLAAVILGAAVLVAWGLHVLVERPVRRMTTAPTPTIAAGLLAGAVLTVTSLVLL
ncbi:MAG: acyltransferase [Actinomycetota bacterium]|nr:acyltransferase [Actinomycetota bacterium]